MKKKLESELISIAHNILKLKGKEDIDALLRETRKLYEKLTVLKFVEEHFGEVQPTIGKSDVISKFEEMAESVLNENTEVPETNPNEEDLVSPLMDTIKDMVAEMPVETIPEPTPVIFSEPEPVEVPAVEPEEAPKTETLDDILASFMAEPTFIKKDEEAITPPSFPPREEAKIIPPPPVELPKPVAEPHKSAKPLSLNDKVFRPGIHIGLNDRIGFVKHLFAGNNDEYNNVLTQLNNTATFEEAQRFIEHIVKPGFNNWEGKEEYEVRFYAIVEKKFN